MDYVFVLCLLAVFSTGFCDNVQRNKSEHEESQVRKNRETSFKALMACGLIRDASCFLDTADAIVEERMNDVLAQADREALTTTGRADAENSPSQLSKAINRIISELTEMFKDSLSGFFKSARDNDEEDEAEENEGEEKQDESEQNSRASVGEARKKKKKKKLLGLIKLIIIGLVLKAKLTLLLKALSAALQVKFFLVALAGLILNAARFYLDLKKGHQPQKVIYYEHAQHQHHYEGDEDWSSGPGSSGSYWGRSYDEEEANSAQNLAYAKQKPYQKVDNNKSSFPWLG